MKQLISQLNIETSGKGFTNITKRLNNWLAEVKSKEGHLLVFLKHTSCSLIINENADPNVLKDLSNYLSGIVPEGKFIPLDGTKMPVEYNHSEEGSDDMPAHIKTMLTLTSLNMSVSNSQLVLGVWQGLYLWEHRDFNKSRQLHLHFIGDFY